MKILLILLTTALIFSISSLSLAERRPFHPRGPHNIANKIERDLNSDGFIKMSPPIMPNSDSTIINSYSTSIPTALEQANQALSE